MCHRILKTGEIVCVADLTGPDILGEGAANINQSAGDKKEIGGRGMACAA